MPISALLPDLHYIDLILENPEDTPIRTHPTPPSQLEHISTGTAFPPVPSFLVEKIELSAFIEMADLIPTRLGLDDTARSKLRRSVTNISEWLQAFTVYISIIVKKQPHRVPDLIGYQILILEASNEYHNDCWLGYTRHFRQQAASQSNCKWSDMDSVQLQVVRYGLHLMEYGFHWSSKNWSMRYCISLFHASKDCEFASDRGMNVEPQYFRLSRTMLRPHRLIFHHWNEQRTPKCSFPNCRYEHICSLCTFNPEATSIHHKAVYRPYHLNQTRSRPPTKVIAAAQFSLIKEYQPQLKKRTKLAETNTWHSVTNVNNRIFLPLKTH